MLNADYEASLWYDREYVAGKNGEAAPIRIQDHNDYREEGGVLQGCQLLPCHHIIIAAAPGESFSDRLTPSGPLSGYDQTNGVAIRNDLPYVALNRMTTLLIWSGYRSRVSTTPRLMPRPRSEIISLSGIVF